jgi:hypothetical protein
MLKPSNASRHEKIKNEQVRDLTKHEEQRSESKPGCKKANVQKGKVQTAKPALVVKLNLTRLRGMVASLVAGDRSPESEEKKAARRTQSSHHAHHQPLRNDQAGKCVLCAENRNITKIHQCFS